MAPMLRPAAIALLALLAFDHLVWGGRYAGTMQRFAWEIWRHVN